MTGHPLKLSAESQTDLGVTTSGLVPLEKGIACASLKLSANTE